MKSIVLAFLLTTNIASAPDFGSKPSRWAEFVPARIDRDKIRLDGPQPAPGIYHLILLARDATASIGLEVSQDRTCPYRGNNDSDPTHDFAITWTLSLPQGAFIRDMRATLRLGQDPQMISLRATRSDSTGAHDLFAWQDFGPVGSGMPGDLPCADTEVALSPILRHTTQIDVGTFMVGLAGNGGGHNGTRVYFLDVTYEVM